MVVTEAWEVMNARITNIFGIVCHILVFKAKSKNWRVLVIGAHTELTWLWMMQHQNFLL
jgi:hypothetical protein